jgi:hypothetical protein
MSEGAKWIISILMIIIGAYVAGWVMFVGGIVDIIDQIKADTLDSMSVAIGVAKVVFAGFVFSVFAFITNLIIES